MNITTIDKGYCEARKAEFELLIKNKNAVENLVKIADFSFSYFGGSFETDGITMADIKRFDHECSLKVTELFKQINSEGKYEMIKNAYKWAMDKGEKESAQMVLYRFIEPSFDSDKIEGLRYVVEEIKPEERFLNVCLGQSLIKKTPGIEKYLISKGAKIESKEVLNICAESIDVLKGLLAKGIDIGLLSQSEYILEEAIYNPELFDFFLSNGLQLCNTTITNPFLLEKIVHEPKILNYLLERNMLDVNAKDQNGTPLIHLAASNLDVLKLLVAKKANLNALDKKGSSISDKEIAPGIREYIESNSASSINSQDNIPFEYLSVKEESLGVPPSGLNIDHTIEG